jgi:NAD(P)-dependent dehydrogenase (short-subunit alcohol dehydrogenase family)
VNICVESSRAENLHQRHKIIVSFQIVRQSNARIASLPQGLVALFIGATSGIGQSILQHFAQHASAPHIYTVARTATVDAHETLLESLRKTRPDGAYHLIRADVSLISEVDKVIEQIKQKETKLDLQFLSAGFMSFEGREDTHEGLDPSMTTRYYSRLRSVQLLLPLLNNSAAVPGPRIMSVLAGGLEGPINEQDLDLRDPDNYSYWNAAVHSATMGTLALERIPLQNPRLSIVHWFPGPVATPGLKRAAQFGMWTQGAMIQDEAGARGLFYATSDRFAVDGGSTSFVPTPGGLQPVKKSGGGIFFLDPIGESSVEASETVLAGMRERGVNDWVWGFTERSSLTLLGTRMKIVRPRMNCEGFRHFDIQ